MVGRVRALGGLKGEFTSPYPPPPWAPRRRGVPPIGVKTLYTYIQVAKQVRTVPVRGRDAEKSLVLRSVI